MAVITNDGISYLQKLAIGQGSIQNYTVRLFTNNITPGYSSVTGDFTECTVDGYSPEALSANSWVGSVSSGVGTYTYPQLLFSFNAYSGGTTIYGYYVTGSAASKTIWCERLAVPYQIPAEGGAITLVLQFVDRNCA